MNVLDTVTPLSRAAATRLVARIAILNLAVLVALQAVVTSPSVTESLQFRPGEFLARPWTLLSYAFVHTGAAHTLLLAALLLLFGPIVARRMGTLRFLGFYLACVVGGAVAAAGLSGFFTIAPLGGSLAPVLGTAIAAAFSLEDDELALDPMPVRLRLRTLLGLSVPLLVAAGLLSGTAALSPAHLGGLLTGWLWFRLRAPGQRPVVAPALPTRRAVMAPVRLEVPESSPARPRTPTASRARAQVPSAPPPQPDPGEVDRLLDKISAQGLDSLTALERRVLSDYSERKRREER